MSLSIDENQTCKGIRSPRKGVKVQFTNTWQLTRVGLLSNQLRQSLSSNVTLDRSHKKEGIFFFNSALKHF